MFSLTRFPEFVKCGNHTRRLALVWRTNSWKAIGTAWMSWVCSPKKASLCVSRHHLWTLSSTSLTRSSFFILQSTSWAKSRILLRLSDSQPRHRIDLIFFPLRVMHASRTLRLASSFRYAPLFDFDFVFAASIPNPLPSYIIPLETLFRCHRSIDRMHTSHEHQSIPCNLPHGHDTYALWYRDTSDLHPQFQTHDPRLAMSPFVLHDSTSFWTLHAPTFDLLFFPFRFFSCFSWLICCSCKIPVTSH